LPPPRSRLRSVLGVVLTVLAATVVYLALAVPDNIAKYKAGSFVPGAFLRLPLEALFMGAVVLAAPRRWRRPAAALMGAGIGVLAILKVANMGFLKVLGRRFNPVLDPPLLKDGYNALVETDGRTAANLAVAGAILLTVGLLAGLTLAVVRLAGVLARRPVPARRALAGLTAVWLALALGGVVLFPKAPMASDSVAALAKSTVRGIPVTLRSQRQFVEASRIDPFRDTPPAELVSGLAGKDVIFGVVESYGRSVLEDPAMAAVLDPTLRAGEQKLAAAGYHAKSGMLTSSTFGGGSWLAHGTFQSGLWINSQQRYRHLTASDRLTITGAFQKSGWRTVGVEPGNTVHWPEASFYGYDTVYDSRNLGYQGPRFGWSRMPDQYTLAAFQRTEYAKRTKPLMAELTLTSSHEPWTPVPSMVDWDSIGDGRVFGPMAEQGEPRGKLWKDQAKTQLEYARSVAYSVDSLVSWAQKYGDKNLVLVIFGDHQPIPLASGQDASHDVPITIVAHDPKVFDRIAGWGWQDGLKPGRDAPVWRMDEFRDRFFTAFGGKTGAARS
jgi:hypothetical protein